MFLLRGGLHGLLKTSSSLRHAAFASSQEVHVFGHASCLHAALQTHQHSIATTSIPASIQPRELSAASSSWAGCRSFASEARGATLQRLSRASRHRAQKAVAVKPDLATPGTEPATTSDPVLVTPSETKASELQLSQAINHPALIITRPVEWGTVIFGYEQANKYQVFDQDGTLCALIAEDVTGLGNEVGRQLLKTRRSFSATVFSADGSQVIFRVIRPAYLITSTMFIEDAEGTRIGEVHRRWSFLQRNYDLYFGKSQFAAIAGNFLAWEFELKDNQGGTLAFIDRNFQGFGKEIFTDAGKYVIHFGMPSTQAAEVATRSTQPAQPGDQQKPTPPITPLALARTDVAVIPTATGNQLVVARPLQLTERMITLACAISIDYDFFSQHSHHGGGLMGGMMPIPIPMPGGGAAPAGTGSDAAGAGAAGAGGAVGEPSQGSEGAAPPGPEQSGGGEQWPGEQKFGGDEQEITWDNGGGESQEGAGSVVGSIWGWVTGDGE